MTTRSEKGSQIGKPAPVEHVSEDTTRGNTAQDVVSSVAPDSDDERFSTWVRENIDMRLGV